MIDKLLSTYRLINHSRLKKFVENPKKSLWVLSGPIIFGLLFQSLYLIVDTFFVIRIGHEAVAAITFAMPVFLIIVALATGFGIGVSSLIAQYVGAQQKEKASLIANHAVIAASILGIFLSLLAYILTPEIFKFLGATNLVLRLVIRYFHIVSVGAFFLSSSIVFRAILAGEGNHLVSSIILIIAAIINLVLDFIFIIVLHGGITGAAWATLIGFLFSFVSYFIFLFIKKTSFLDFNFRRFNFSLDLLKKIFRIGAPVAFSQVLLSCGTIVINYFVSRFGHEYMAGFGLASRLEVFYTVIILGISSGLLTLLGMYIGAKRYDLVVLIVKYTIKTTLIISIFVGVILYFLSGIFLSVFTNSNVLIKIGVSYFQIVVFSYPIIAIIYIVAKLLQIAHHPIKDILINIYRLFIFFLPLLFLFVYILAWGIRGIWYAKLGATILSLFIALYFFCTIMPEIKKKCN